jgi:hypothetical protein
MYRLRWKMGRRSDKFRSDNDINDGWSFIDMTSQRDIGKRFNYLEMMSTARMVNSYIYYNNTYIPGCFKQMCLNSKSRHL